MKIQMVRRFKLLQLVIFSFSIYIAASAQVLEINGNQFLYDKKPFDMWGMRVASASQNDEYTALLLSSLDDYKKSGINTISVFLQGSSGGFSDPFSPDGKQIDEDHLNRIIKIIRTCQKQEMVVVVGIDRKSVV
jgi:hypothetical protein